MENEKEKLNDIFEHIDENFQIVECKGIVSIKKETDRARSILVTLPSAWDVRKILAKAPLLRTFRNKVYISKCLSPSDRKIEQILLKKRCDLISSKNIDRKCIKIKNLTLYISDEEYIFPEGEENNEN